MSIVIIGADKLGNIPKNLKELGYTDITHISGRDINRISIPKYTDAVLVLTNFVKHNITNSLKKNLKNDNINVYYAKRSWTCIEQALKSS